MYLFISFTIPITMSPVRIPVSRNPNILQIVQLNVIKNEHNVHPQMAINILINHNIILENNFLFFIFFHLNH